MSALVVRNALTSMAIAGLLACSSSSGSSPSGPSTNDGGAEAAAGPITLPTHLAVTADWLDHRLSVIDYDALTTAPGTAGRIATIDLSQYAHGPYSVKITPDGKSAVVTLSAGFLGVPLAGNLLVGAPSVPTGPSRVLVVDLTTRAITADLDTGEGAAGVNVTHDGRTAFVTHADTSMLTVIDLATKTITQQVDLGSGSTFAEEVGIDDSDTVGIVTSLDPATANKVARTFAIANPSVLSEPIALDNDAAGVPFFPGTKVAFVTLAYNPLSRSSGYALIDASNPNAPVKLAQATQTDPVYVAFDATASSARGSVLVPVTSKGTLQVREYTLAGNDVTLANTFDVAPAKHLLGAFGLAVDANGRAAITMPGDRQIGVLDLNTKGTFVVPWSETASPMGISLH